VEVEAERSHQRMAVVAGVVFASGVVRIPAYGAVDQDDA